jgi:hypothetical protein
MGLKSGVADAPYSPFPDDRLARRFSVPIAGYFQACTETSPRPGALVYKSPLRSRGTSAACLDEPYYLGGCWIGSD